MKPEKHQIDRFKEAARELEAEDDEKRFNEALRKIARDGTRDKGDSNGPKGKDDRDG